MYFCGVYYKLLFDNLVRTLIYLNYDCKERNKNCSKEHCKESHYKRDKQLTWRHSQVAKITEEEAYLGIGWLFKEGKVKDENSKIVLA